VLPSDFVQVANKKTYRKKTKRGTISKEKYMETKNFIKHIMVTKDIPVLLLQDNH
jgi:hypothetical protein